MKNIASFILLIALAFSAVAQTSPVTITPLHPEIGQTVRIDFHPSGIVVNPPVLTVSYSNFYEMPTNIPMVRNGDDWKMEFTVPRYAKYASFYITAADSVYKPKEGHYELIFYNAGKPVLDTYLYKSYSLAAQYTKEKPAAFTLRDLYEKELSIHPENYPSKLLLLMVKMKDDKTNAAKYKAEALQTVVNKMNENPTTMGNINLVTMGYLMLNENARIDTLKKMLLAKYPKSEVAFEYLFEDAYKTKNVQEKVKKLEKLLTSQANREPGTLSDIHEQLFNYYAAQGNEKVAISHAKVSAYHQDPWLPRQLKDMAQTLADNNLALDTAEKYANMALKNVNNFPFGVIRYFPEYGYIPGYVENREGRIQTEKGNILSLLGYIYTKQGKMEAAEKTFAAARKLSSEIEVYRHLSYYHEQQKNPKAAFDDYRKMLLQLPTDSAMLAGFKRNYVAFNGAEKGYDNALKSMLTDWEHDNLPKYAKFKLNTPAPPLTDVFDMNGKLVDPATLRGKVLVLDFWATWCIPCIEGFPYMQKVYERYKDNPNVVFLITNSGSKNSLVDAQEWVKKNIFTFPFYYNDRKLAESFSVNTIPSTFIIDQNGVIQYKTVGFEGPIMEPKLGLQIKSLLPADK